MIGLLGGSFNPPTNSHLNIAKLVLRSVKDVNCVFLQPTYKHTFGKEKNYMKNRLEMLKSIEEYNIRLSTFEIDFKLDCGTYETLKKMNMVYKESEFIPIIGSDCLFEFEKWKNYEKLAKEYKFIIIKRPGYDINKYDGILKNNIILENNDFTSSTEVRKKLANNEDISNLVPKSVLKHVI
jgi:nicotinate-nucleotide adenylyltransferase